LYMRESNPTTVSMDKSPELKDSISLKKPTAAVPHWSESMNNFVYSVVQMTDLPYAGGLE